MISFLLNVVGNLKWTTLYIILLYPLQNEGTKSFCIAPTVKAGETGIISCLFTKDLSSAPQSDVNVYLYLGTDYTTEPRLVLSYQWLNGLSRIATEEDYKCMGNLTDHVEIAIYNVSREHAGGYKCFIAAYRHDINFCVLHIYEERSISSNSLISTVDVQDFQGIESFCIAPPVSFGKTGNISCRFSKDLSIVSSKYIRVYLHKASDNEPYTVFLHTWDDGSAHVYTMPGYEIKGKLTDHLEISVLNATIENAGTYKCIVGPFTTRPANNCTLYVNGDKSISTTGTISSAEGTVENHKGIESFCISKPVSAGQTGIISCHFMNSFISLKDLRVTLYKDGVLFDTWVYGASPLEARSYKWIGNRTDHLEIAIYNVTKENAGHYTCMIFPSTNHKFTPCTLRINEVRRRSVTSPYQTTTPPRTESDKSSSKTSSYNEVDDLELTARIREEADSVEYTRPSPPTAHAHSTRTALSSHAERLIAVPQEAVTIEQAARAQQPEYVEIENEVRPNGDDGYLVPAGQYASLNPATRSEEGHEYENLGSRPTESSSTPGYSGLVKSTKREKHLYDRLRRETNQTIEAEEEDPTYAIALEQMPGPTFTKL